MLGSGIFFGIKIISLYCPQPQTDTGRREQPANCFFEEAKTLVPKRYLSSLNGISETELKGEAMASRA